jgi:opacity protein-like surface antigen
MTKLLSSHAALALVLAIPAVAAAQTAPSSGGQSSCPPGSWFCAQPPQQQPAPAGQQVAPLQPLPDPDDEEAPAPPVRRAPPVTYEPAPRQPPPVVYQPPPPTMVVRPEAPPPYEYMPPHRSVYPTPPREWGLNLHLEGAMIGHGNAGDAGLGGAGLGLRFKPTRYFGIESDLDFLGGHGYGGDDRHETGLSFNGLLFLNPRSRAQLYLLAGFGWAWAHSVCDPSTGATCPGGLSVDAQYNYFGGQIGAGLEVRLTRSVAFNVDLRGFMRSRTDAIAQQTPEFGPDSQGRTTNTSGGGLLTGGMTLYF